MLAVPSLDSDRRRGVCASVLKQVDREEVMAPEVCVQERESRQFLSLTGMGRKRWERSLEMGGGKGTKEKGRGQVRRPARVRSGVLKSLQAPAKNLKPVSVVQKRQIT